MTERVVDYKIALAKAEERMAEPMEFGDGRFVIDTGWYGGCPAVFIAVASIPGKPGQSSVRENHRRDVLQPGERVITFQTIKQAQQVADALCGATNAQLAASQAAYAELVGKVRHILKSIRQTLREKAPETPITHIRLTLEQSVVAEAYALLADLPEK